MEKILHRVDDSSYLKMVSNRLGESIEDVYVAFLQYGRDFKRIALNLHRCGTWM
jgi:hypothetical protein